MQHDRMAIQTQLLTSWEQLPAHTRLALILHLRGCLRVN